jgi:hypothetical protein
MMAPVSHIGWTGNAPAAQAKGLAIYSRSARNLTPAQRGSDHRSAGGACHAEYRCLCHSLRDQFLSSHSRRPGPQYSQPALVVSSHCRLRALVCRKPLGESCVAVTDGKRCPMVCAACRSDRKPSYSWTLPAVQSHYSILGLRPGSLSVSKRSERAPGVLFLHVSEPTSVTLKDISGNVLANYTIPVLPPAPITREPVVTTPPPSTASERPYTVAEMLAMDWTTRQATVRRMAPRGHFSVRNTKGQSPETGD